MKTIKKIISFLPKLLCLASMGLLLLEAFTYQGVVRAHSFIDARVIAFFSLLLFTLTSHWKDSPFGKIKRFGTMNAAFSIILFFSFLAFTILETATFPNFVFSTFHLQSQLLLFPAFLSLAIYLIIGWKGLLHYGTDRLRRIKFLKTFLIFFLGGILAANLVSDKNFWISNLLKIKDKPFATYDDKMRKEVGSLFYDYAQFIKQNTPENSTILIPPYPAYPWPQTGNAAYLRYFLYPRNLINGNEMDPGDDYRQGRIDYVLIAWGETQTVSSGYTHGWPKFDVPAQKIIYLEGQPLRINTKYYIYSDHKNTESWGIIEVRQQ